MDVWLIKSNSQQVFMYTCALLMNSRKVCTCVQPQGHKPSTLTCKIPCSNTNQLATSIVQKPAIAVEPIKVIKKL